MSARIRKYVAIGPESTGKSTLCQRLSEYYQTQWSAEYARQYLEENGSGYTYDDLVKIAKGQLQGENHYADIVRRDARSGLLFVDTDMHVMRVWCEFVFGNCHKFILDQIAERRYDGYFLCAPDLPWVKDPLREYPDQRTRDELFLYYKELLTAENVPWVRIEGDYEQRMKTAVQFIDGQKNILLRT